MLEHLKASKLHDPVFDDRPRVVLKIENIHFVYCDASASYPQLTLTWTFVIASTSSRRHLSRTVLY